jgi:hypothetical protein
MDLRDQYLNLSARGQQDPYAAQLGIPAYAPSTAIKPPIEDALFDLNQTIATVEKSLESLSHKLSWIMRPSCPEKLSNEKPPVIESVSPVVLAIKSATANVHKILATIDGIDKRLDT